MALDEEQKKAALLNELGRRRRAYSGFNVAERHLSVRPVSEGRPDRVQSPNASNATSKSTVQD